MNQFPRFPIAVLLAVSLTLPSPTYALRPQLDLSGLEEKLTPVRAGLEESSFERRILRELESIRVQAERQLHVAINVAWYKLGSDAPQYKMGALADTFLDYPDPLSVKKKVRGLMRRMNRRILDPLLRADPRRLSKDMRELREWVLILPIADDWLVRAYSPVMPISVLFRNRTWALAVYSRRAAAEAWGRNGPHLRADFVPFDKDDVNTAPILLRAFLPEAQRQMGKLQRLGKERAGDRLKRKAEEYAGALFNGLLVPGQDRARRPFKAYKRYFDGWAAESNGRLRPAIGQAAQLFPQKFPLEPARMPAFLRFSNEPFAKQEIGQIREFNRSHRGPPLTLWQLTAGTGATEEYIHYLEYRDSNPLSRRPRLMEQVYGYVLEQGGVVVPAPAAGAEERMNQMAAMAEEAAQGGGVVIVDAAGVEEQPVLQAFLERFKPVSPVVILGTSPAAQDLRRNPRLLFVSDVEELAGLLMELKDRGITQVTYLSGRPSRIEPVVRERGFSFTQSGLSLKTLLAGFMPAPLAVELAAGVEEMELLGTEA